jgi:radical SAM superfamily enzyme YgiQ (UPF0313 family)
MTSEIISGFVPERTGDLILVNSPMRDYDQRPKDDYEVLPPLGLGYIATGAHMDGHNVGILDAEHQGIGLRVLTDKLNKISPRIVGLNVLTPTRTVALNIAKGLNQDINLLIGGAQASAMPKETLLEFSSIHSKTLLISQEGELPVEALLNGIPKELIPNLFWIDDKGVIRENQTEVLMDLDSLPILDRSFLVNDPSKDKRTGLIESRVITSRGCPFNCSTCAGAREVNITNANLRNRKPQNIAEEIHDLVNNYGCGSIRFVDDIFIASEKRSRSILDAVASAGVNRFVWDANGRANILARFKPELLDYIKEHGAHEIAIGIESGSERLRKRINKQVSEAEIRFSISELNKRDIKVKGYFMIGLPTETKEETKSTIAMAKDLTIRSGSSFRASIFVFRPYPGTKEWTYLTGLGCTAESLLSMHAAGQGERSKHEVLTTQRYAELEPQRLQQMLEEYNTWQSGTFIE